MMIATLRSAAQASLDIAPLALIAREPEPRAVADVFEADES